ncbi:MAG: hypothetical protein ACRBFS_14720 [Aureispira sp.]
MNCNTHGFGCLGRTNNHERGAGELLDATKTVKTTAAYRIYGALWLNKNKVIFYLDSKKIGEVVPPVDFNLEHYK